MGESWAMSMNYHSKEARRCLPRFTRVISGDGDYRWRTTVLMVSNWAMISGFRAAPVGIGLDNKLVDDEWFSRKRGNGEIMSEATRFLLLHAEYSR